MADIHSLQLHSSFGTHVAGIEEATWRCNDARLRSLDVADSPELTTLDLTDASGLEHLTIQGCPALVTIHLPMLARVTLHVDAGRKEPALRVMGGLEHIDACWEGGRFSADCEDLAPWMHALVGDADFVSHFGQQADLQIVLGDYAVEAEASVNARVCSPNLRHLLVVGCHRLERLEVSTQAGRLETLHIDHAEKLEWVVLQRKLLQASFQDARRLACLEGPTDTLSIKRSTQRGEGLEITGHHRVVRMVACGLKRLKMAHSCDLLLLRCRRLRQLQVPQVTRVHYQDLIPPRLEERDQLRIDESLARQMRRYFLEGEQTALDELKSLMPRMAGRRQAVHALILLERLADDGVDPSRLWALRQELMARHVFGHLSSLDTPWPTLLSASRRIWLWNLPRDLAFEGWAADYRLWLRACEADDKEAQRYGRTMLHTCLDDVEGPAVRTVIEHVIRHRTIPNPNAVRLLHKLLFRLPSRARKQLGSAQQLPDALSWSQGLALHMGRHGTGFDRAVVSFARRTLRPHDFLAFAAFEGARHALVREHLMRMAEGQVRYPLPPHEARELPSLKEHARRLLQSASEQPPLLD
ncbi:hypothetical protein [Halomonas sp.]|uniref:hypothetical protein n=1 Tax=Halomonas sp. TaxID=1486246 RepID=UPI003D11F516